MQTCCRYSAGLKLLPSSKQSSHEGVPNGSPPDKSSIILHGMVAIFEPDLNSPEVFLLLNHVFQQCSASYPVV